MLDILFILENKDIVKNAIKNKNKEMVDFDNIESLYNRRAKLVKELNEVNHKRKVASNERNIEEGTKLKQDGGKIEEDLRNTTSELTKIISKIPNIPSPDVPIGKDENENIIIKSWGEKKSFDFEPKPHWVIGEERDIIDNKRAAKVSGSRFTYIKGNLARMQFAIVNWVFSVVSNENILKEIIDKNKLRVPHKIFTPIIPPVMITPQMFFGMARIEPREERYYFKDDNLFLIGSAEHTLGPMHSGETFSEDELPIRYIGYSTNFRREAGSYGKDTKGIIRQHQFDKLEFECFTVGEKSREEQDFLVAIQEYLLQQLNLPYQVVSVCTGDMGTPDIRQIDIETFMPGQKVYRETHSADLMGEYQSRRLGMKVKRNSGEKEFVHTNDATAIALGRILIAIIENNQCLDGSIVVPQVLREYMSNIELI